MSGASFLSMGSSVLDIWKLFAAIQFCIHFQRNNHTLACKHPTVVLVRMLTEACPPPDTGRGRGPPDTSSRFAGTQEMVGGAGVERDSAERSPPGGYSLPPHSYKMTNEKRLTSSQLDFLVSLTFSASSESSQNFFCSCESGQTEILGLLFCILFLPAGQSQQLPSRSSENSC